VLGAVASLGPLKFSDHGLGTLATVLALVALAGSLAILAGGLACLRASSHGTASLDRGRC
jgi:hypothetical protein